MKKHARIIYMICSICLSLMLSSCAAAPSDASSADGSAVSGAASQSETSQSEMPQTTPSVNEASAPADNSGNDPCSHVISHRGASGEEI